MPHYIQNNFTAGEISPRLAARSDLEKYKNGVKELTNFMVLPHGGVQSRPGTRFVAECKDSSHVVLVRRFEFNTDQAYIIEIGALYMRFYMDGGRIESPPGTPVEIVTPYDYFDLLGLRFEQSADTLYITHVRHAPRKLTRSSHTSWSLVGIDFINGPYFPENETDTTVTPSGTTGSITLTASAALFDPDHVLSHFQIFQGSTYGWAKITAYTSPTVVTATVQGDALGGTTATKKWRLGAWGTKQGFPACCGFNEERLFFAGSLTSPLSVWGSRTGDFENMTPGTSDDSAVEYTIASSRVNGFKWIMQDRGMLLGTAGAEFILDGGGNPLSPSNVQAKIQTTYGSNDVTPIKAGNMTIFTQRQGRKLRSLSYSFQSDAYAAPNLTLLSEHITESGVVDMAYQQEPDSIIWCVLYDGTLLSLTYLQDQEVMGWAKHTTQGFFESVAVIPSDGIDQAWFTVQRVVNGVAKRYVEYFDPSLCTDSALSDDGGPYVSVGNIDHLEGMTVAIKGDGAVYPNGTVTSGSLDIDPPATAVEVGLSFIPRLVTLRPEIETPDGTIQGRKRRWVRCFARVFETIGISINGDQVESRSTGDNMDEIPPTFTGDIPVTTIGWDREGEIAIEQTQPLPATILSVFGEVGIGD